MRRPQKCRILSPVSSFRTSWLSFLLYVYLFSNYQQHHAVVADDGNSQQQQHCGADDSTAVSSNVPLTSLSPNTFHKICPSQSKYHQFLGHPGCGDGSAFAFYVARPPQRKDNQNKIMIEFAGGGACWDSNTCDRQQSYLAFPEQWNDFVGLSCSELEAGMQSQGKSVSMLCAKSLGDTDLTGYTTLVVPYCTQDVHSGDNVVTYDNNADDDNGGGGDSSQTVVHRGAHNMMAVLRYVYKNFKNPERIVLTGCSAGGTALPLAYHLLHKHYNRLLGVPTGSTQISVIADSPVYLTPEYFLEDAFDNWNPWTLVHRLGVSQYLFNKWRYDEAYPTLLWDYILRQGSNRDQWGFVQHTDDPVSQAYYQWMSGNGGDGDGRNRRRLDDDSAAEWWSQLSGSLDTIQAKHPNVHTYFMDQEEGHCTFGLYYGLQESGFEEWAADILQERRMGVAGTVNGPFLWAAMAGVLLSIGIVYSAKHHCDQYNRNPLESSSPGVFLKYEDHDDDSNRSASLSMTTKDWSKDWKDRLRAIAVRVWLLVVPLLKRFAGYPITAGYTLTVSLYFWIMILREGFTHPLNNPSLGPNAIALSSFGINNPSLIVYKTQVFRLITSSFLCSGVLTYLLSLLCLWSSIRPFERQVARPTEFGIVAALILAGSNLVYALLCNGASCSSLALVLGLNAFILAVRIKVTSESKCMLATTTVALSLLVSLVFPFNSWIVILAALALGVLLALVVFDVAVARASEENGDCTAAIINDSGDQAQLSLVAKRWRLYTLLVVYGILFLVLLLRLRRPNALYADSPFYTGCDLKYSAALGDISSSYFGGEGDRRRWLEEAANDGDGDDDGLCAQFCIPHILSRAATFGARSIFSFEIQDGTCPSEYEHYVDKTFEYFTYSLDVEIFQSNDGNDE